MADKLPENMAELLSQIEHEWKELWRTVGRLSPEQMTTPDSGGWSPKDNLAHLAEWMRYMQDCYLKKKPAAESMNIPAATYAALDEDGVNAVLLERNRDRPVSEVVDGLKRTYAAALETLRSMPFEDMMKPLQADDPENGPVIDWVLRNTSAHFLEHRQNIEKQL
jgi:hypothetical protein